jgi:anti-sigma factor RsiW
LKTCENIPQIHAYHDGQLSEHASQQLQAHLQYCPLCAAELESLRQVSDLFSSSTLPEMTPLMLAQVHQRVDQRMNARIEHGVMRLAQWLSAAAAAILVVSSLQLAFMHNSASADASPHLAWHMTTAMLSQETPLGESVTEEQSVTAWIVADLSTAMRSTQAGEQTP